MQQLQTGIFGLPWDAWGAILAIVGLFATVIIAIVTYWLSRQSKMLSYDLSNYRLLTVRDETHGKIKIFYEDKPIQNIQVISLRLINTGNLPITVGDYERPITIAFSPLNQIFSTFITRTEPKNLSPTVSIIGHQVVLQPILMNRNDSFTINIWIDKIVTEPYIDARIAGVRSLRSLKEVSSKRETIIGIFLIIFFLGFILPTNNPFVYVTSMFGFGVLVLMDAFNKLKNIFSRE